MQRKLKYELLDAHDTRLAVGQFDANAKDRTGRLANVGLERGHLRQHRHSVFFREATCLVLKTVWAYSFLSRSSIRIHVPATSPVALVRACPDRRRQSERTALCRRKRRCGVL
jgi:hypothetical protein